MKSIGVNRGTFFGRDKKWKKPLSFMSKSLISVMINLNLLNYKTMIFKSLENLKNSGFFSIYFLLFTRKVCKMKR